MFGESNPALWKGIVRFNVNSFPVRVVVRESTGGPAEDAVCNIKVTEGIKREQPLGDAESCFTTKIRQVMLNPSKVLALYNPINSALLHNCSLKVLVASQTVFFCLRHGIVECLCQWAQRDSVVYGLLGLPIDACTSNNLKHLPVQLQLHPSQRRRKESSVDLHRCFLLFKLHKMCLPCNFLLYAIFFF